MILVAYRHGMRASEICNLRMDDVDLKRRAITVRRLKGSLDTVQPLYQHRGVPLLGKLAALRAYLRDREADGSDFLFVSQEGGRLHRSQFFRLFQAIAEAAGLPNDAGNVNLAL